MGYFGLFFTNVLFWFEEIYVRNVEVIRWLHERSVWSDHGRLWNETKERFMDEKR